MAGLPSDEPPGQPSGQPPGQPPSLTLGPVLGDACPVRDDQGRQVGNLKWIGGRWKFKAIGHDERGQVIPGGGPLTDRHNLVFDRLDGAAISRRLLGD